MFLKNLKIENYDKVIRDIHFHKGINLIIDETKTSDKRDSGNNVGKTTVLKLIDFCLGSKGENIYKDTEFKQKINTEVEKFLKEKNVIITLTLKADLTDENSKEIIIRRNFLNRRHKIQEINSKKVSDKDFSKELKKLIFNSEIEKPSFRQIIAKNIRYEKNKLVNAIKVLDAFATQNTCEALYLFWLGINLDDKQRKDTLTRDKKTEEKIQERLKKENSLSQITHSLIVIDRLIKELEAKKDNLNINDNYKNEMSVLNKTTAEINKTSVEISRLDLRRDLIIESKTDLEKEHSEIDLYQIKNIYEEAKVLVPTIQKTFEDTLKFHNQMVAEKIKYITQELPVLEANVISLKSKLDKLLEQEKELTVKLKKSGAFDEMNGINSELYQAHEKKGNFERAKETWETSIESLKQIESEIETINSEIKSKDDIIQDRVKEFNKYFADISNRLYGELFVLSADNIEGKSYELNISSISGNLGTGKKKGQIAAFDLAYIQFVDALNIDCLHFILHDQIEVVDDNQISSLLTEIVSHINCQYILPVLRDKLPSDIDAKKYEIISLSKIEKLFKI